MATSQQCLYSKTAEYQTWLDGLNNFLPGYGTYGVNVNYITPDGDKKTRITYYGVGDLPDTYELYNPIPEKTCICC